MRASVVPGLSHRASLTVTDELVVPALSPHFPDFSEMPPVFATAYLVGFIEATCIECLQGHLDEGERTVGVRVNVSHSAATPTGMTVTADVRLTEVAGRILTFEVHAFDDAGSIGEGVHQRAVINVDRFLKKLETKKA